MAETSTSTNIVVVDDEPASLEFCCSALRRAGYTVWAASGAKQALQYFQPNRPAVALALIDIVMPETSGIALIKQLEQLNPPERIILMSGYAPDEVKRLVGTEAARYRTIWKPFEADTLIRLIKNVLDTPAPPKGQAARES